MFWYIWEDTWEITENLAALLFIAVNHWVSCDVTKSITQLNTVIRKCCSAFVKRVFSQLIKMTLLFSTRSPGTWDQHHKDGRFFSFHLWRLIAVIRHYHRMRSSNDAQHLRSASFDCRWTEVALIVLLSAKQESTQTQTSATASGTSVHDHAQHLLFSNALWASAFITSQTHSICV